MNERIRELARKNADYWMNHYDRKSLADMELLSKDVGKFAELIVRECIEVFSKDMPDPMSPDYQLGTLNEVVNRVCNVAEHFGVEE